MQFTAREGFLLNGKRVQINGTCNHHDLGALGAALNERALERQLEILKAMGCNALRTSHNPPAPQLLAWPLGAANAALFAVAMLANDDPALRAKLDAFRAAQTDIARGMTLPPVL